MPPLDTISQQTDLYNNLYNLGYHQDLWISHSTPLIEAVDAINAQARKAKETPPLRSVLDVGCSHGLAVFRLWRRNLTASGVDISSVAISTAKRMRTDICDAPDSPEAKQMTIHLSAQKRTSFLQGCQRRNCIGPCFQQASATALPFANCSFDAVISSDVLEHLPTRHVPEAIGELTRVARRVLLLKISNRREGPTKQLDALRRANRQSARSLSRSSSENRESHPELVGAVPRQLHLTVKPQSFWQREIERHPGWHYNQSLEDHNRWLALNRRHFCCHTVFRRRDEALCRAA